MTGKATLIRDAILIGLVLLSLVFAVAGFRKVEEQQRELLDLKGEVQKLRETLQPTPRPFSSQGDETVSWSTLRHLFGDGQTTLPITEVPIPQVVAGQHRLLMT